MCGPACVALCGRQHPTVICSWSAIVKPGQIVVSPAPAPAPPFCRVSALVPSSTQARARTHTHTLARSHSRTRSLSLSLTRIHTHSLARAQTHTHAPGNRSHTDRAALNEPRMAAIKTGSMSLTRRTSCSCSRFSRGVPRHEQARGRGGAKDKTVTRRLPLQKITARRRWPLVKAKETQKRGHGPVCKPLCLVSFFFFCQKRT